MRTRTMQFAAFLVALGVGAVAQAYTAILTTEHADIAAAFEGGAWDPHVHDEDNDVEYAPADVLLFGGANLRVNRPSGSQWDFTGAAAGSTLWVYPQTQDPAKLFLGVAAEELDPADWTGPVRLEFVSVDGPGQFSAWTSDAFGSPVARFSSATPGSVPNFFEVPVGGHAHMNFGLTATGIHKVTFRWSAVSATTGQRSFSDPTEYHFGVEAVPEPASLAALGLGALALIRRRRAARG